MEANDVILLLIPVIVPVLVQVLKTKIWPTIPRVYIPIACALMGIGMDMFHDWCVQNPEWSIVEGAFLGAGGNWLNQIYRSFKSDSEKGSKDRRVET
jgi:hypothetical protein